jgi:hypothetical protein
MLSAAFALQAEAMNKQPGIDLYWLPLGAGGHFVRMNGRIYEAIAARLEGRPSFDLYHSALIVSSADAQFVIEQAPLGADPDARGVVARGRVWTKRAPRWGMFRYEVRCWRDGVIPDIGEAVDSPQRVSDDGDQAADVLQLVRAVPTPVWGRDELGTGEMWNSNSVVSWLLARAGVPMAGISPPQGGRAPGWDAGLVLAFRDQLSAIGDTSLSVPPVVP